MRPGSSTDVSIVTSGHDVADARIHRVTAALTRQGLGVEVLGLGAAADGPAGARVTTAPRPGLLGRARLALRYAATARGAVLVALDPDSLLAVQVLGRLRRRAVVADVHEDYGALLRDRAWAVGWRRRVAAAVVGLADAAARAADLVVVADEHVPPLTARHRLVLRNLPDPGMLPSPGDREGPPRALYVGDVRGSRGLWAMVDAVAQAPGWTLDVVGPVAGADEQRLASRLAEPGLAGRVRLHGRQPPARAWELARGAWCGLALLEDTPAFRDAVPSKLYEYLACGLAVVVTDLPRSRALVTEAGAGVVVATGPGTAAQVAQTLRGWADQPEDLDRLREAAARWRAGGAGDEYAAVARALGELATRAPR